MPERLIRSSCYSVFSSVLGYILHLQTQQTTIRIINRIKNVIATHGASLVASIGISVDVKVPSIALVFTPNVTVSSSKLNEVTKDFRKGIPSRNSSTTHETKISHLCAF